MFEYRIEHRDTDAVLIERIEDIVVDFEFEDNRIGGLGFFEFSIKRIVNQEPIFEADDEIVLSVNTGGGFEDWYVGYVESYEPRIEDEETWSVRGTGYFGHLDRLIVTKTYTYTSVETIVKNILDDYVVGQTGVDVTYDADDIEATGLLITEITFDDTVLNAMKKLADLVGKREWGVDQNRKFFFKERSDAISFVNFSGAESSSYQRLDDYQDIINRVEVRGGRKDDNSIYSLQINNTDSQTIFGLRAKILTNSSIKNDIDANRYGLATLQDASNLSRKARLVIENSTIFYHQTRPIGVVQVPDATENKDVPLYGVPLYGVKKYAGVDSYQLSSIKYRLKTSGFDVQLTLGSPRPELSNPIAALNFGIENIRQV